MRDITQIKTGIFRSQITLIIVIGLLGMMAWLGMRYASLNMSSIVEDYPAIVAVYRLSELQSSIKSEEGLLLNQELNANDVRRVYHRIDQDWILVGSCWNTINEEGSGGDQWCALWREFRNKWKKWEKSHRYFISLSHKLDDLGYRKRYQVGRGVTEPEIDLLVKMGEYNQIITEKHYQGVRDVLNRITNKYMTENVTIAKNANTTLRTITYGLLTIVLISILCALIYSLLISKNLGTRNEEIFHDINSANIRLSQEIVERNEAQKKLRQSENDLSITLNSIGDAVIATDISGCVTRMNPVAESLTGWSIEDAIGKPMNDVFGIINAFTREAVESPVQKVLASGEIVGLADDTLLLAKDDKEYRIADSGAPIRNENGDIIGVVVVFRDVTEEHIMQEKLQHSQKMDAIGQLAGGVAHDFNNMLGGIMGSADLMAIKYPDDEQIQRACRMIVNASERASDLTQSLLAFACKQQIASSCVDVNTVLEEAVALLQRTLDPRIEIEIDMSSEVMMVSGAPSQLQSAFLNLCINASHSMPEGGVLSIKSKITMLDSHYCSTSSFNIKPGAFAEIEIRDTGCGIAPELLTRIFEPFFTTKRQGEGTGLGLAAVYGTIQQHNGAINVYSEIGRGTCFHVLLPLSDFTENSAYQTEEIITGSGRILVVDDEEVMRDAAVSILEEIGYEVIAVENGAEALEVFKRELGSIDLVLLDMVMPVMNGRDCFKELKSISPDVRVVLASGFSRDEDVEAMESMGLSGFIYKPYRSVALSRLVSEVLRG